MADPDPEAPPAAGLSPTDLATVAGVLRAAYSAASSLSDEEARGPEVSELTVLAALMSADAEVAVGSVLEDLVRAISSES